MNKNNIQSQTDVGFILMLFVLGCCIVCYFVATWGVAIPWIGGAYAEGEKSDPFIGSSFSGLVSMGAYAGVYFFIGPVLVLNASVFGVDAATKRIGCLRKQLSKPIASVLLISAVILGGSAGYFTGRLLSGLL